MYYFFLDDKIKEMEERLVELEPAVRESAALKESIASLKSISARQKGEEVSSEVQFEEMQPYMRLPARKAQVAEVLSEDPSSTNQQIADKLGLTAARVSQIRSAMAIDEDA